MQWSMRPLGGVVGCRGECCMSWIVRGVRWSASCDGTTSLHCCGVGECSKSIERLQKDIK